MRILLSNGRNRLFRLNLRLMIEGILILEDFYSVLWLLLRYYSEAFLTLFALIRNLGLKTSIFIPISPLRVQRVNLHRLILKNSLFLALKLRP